MSLEGEPIAAHIKELLIHRTTFFPHACSSTVYDEGAMASTRTGLPLPCTILSGAAMRMVPVGGS
jgi:hypothetical protein